MKKLITPVLLLALLAPLLLFGNEKKELSKIDLRALSADKFLEIVRHAPSQETWTKLIGKVQHRRSGSSTITSTLRLGVRFMPSRISGQLVLDNEEMYMLGQTFSEPRKASKMLFGRARNTDEAKLGLYGIAPDDLLLGFLYQEMVSEEKPQTVSIFHCRVFVMKTETAGEFARVSISTDYAFPLRVEWFKENPHLKTDAEAYRTMEIVSLKELDNKFVVISQLRLDGPGWRTKVEFDVMEAGYAKDGVPTDIFLPQIQNGQ